MLERPSEIGPDGKAGRVYAGKLVACWSHVSQGPTQSHSSRMTVWMNLGATIGIGLQRAGLGPDMPSPGFLTCDGEHLE